MRYRLFGPTGLRVSELFLGAMTFGEQGGVGAPPEECARILDESLNARLQGPAGLQLTLFSDLSAGPGNGEGTASPQTPRHTREQTDERPSGHR